MAVTREEYDSLLARVAALEPVKIEVKLSSEGCDHIASLVRSLVNESVRALSLAAAQQAIRRR